MRLLNMQLEYLVFAFGEGETRGLGCEEFLVPSLRDYEASREPH
jgi:hypothetical protein